MRQQTRDGSTPAQSENNKRQSLFKGIGEFLRYLFLTSAGDSKRRAEQQAYEDRLDEKKP